MITNRSVRFLIRVMVLLLVSCAIFLAYGRSMAKPNEPLEVSDAWDNPHYKISNSVHGARKPVIRASSVSDRILLVYDHWTASGGEGNKDPYYSISTNNGESWPAGAAIVETPDGSNQTVGILDNNDTAWALWVEHAPLLFSIAYTSKTENGNWATVDKIDEINTSDGILFDPDITVDDHNTVHVVWSRQVFSTLQHNIYYAYRAQGDADFSNPILIQASLPNSREPSIAVSSSGKLYIVWEEAVAGGGAEIRLSAGTISGGSFVVDPNLEYVKLSPDALSEVVLPQVSIHDNRMRVSYTNNLSLEYQGVYFGSCELPCYGFDANDFRSVSGLVSVNGNDPTNLVSDMAYATGRKATFIFYHGAQNPSANEAILGTTSCQGWAGGYSNVATDPGAYRAIEPSITITGNEIHLAYDRVSSSPSGFDHQIYVTKSELDCSNLVYLPVVNRK